jgi:hypothetical protein
LLFAARCQNDPNQPCSFDSFDWFALVILFESPFIQKIIFNHCIHVCPCIYVPHRVCTYCTVHLWIVRLNGQSLWMYLNIYIYLNKYIWLKYKAEDRRLECFRKIYDVHTCIMFMGRWY